MEPCHAIAGAETPTVDIAFEGIKLAIETVCWPPHCFDRIADVVPDSIKGSTGFVAVA